MPDTFLDVGPPTSSSEVVILGAALSTVYADRDPHATAGPLAIRSASRRLAPFAGHYDFDTGGPFAAWRDRVADGGDVTVSRDDPRGNRDRIAAVLRDVASMGALPVLLGGDDSLAIPFVAAWQDRGPVTVVHIDAHLDFRDEIAGERYGYSSPMRRASEMAWIGRIIHIGQRGVGSARPSDVRDSLAAGSTIITASELELMGPKAVAARLDLSERFIVVYDVDGTDPSELPAVRAPVAGGPGLAVIARLISELVARGRFEGMVLTEYEPQLDPAGTAARELVRIICRTLDGVLG
jgi:agmatinase